MYLYIMICSFACRDTEKIWGGMYAKKFPNAIQNRALRKLRQLDASQSLDDLKNPPGNRLEKLKGDRKGQYSLRINEQWRICFEWRGGNAYQLEIIDYHS